MSSAQPDGLFHAELAFMNRKEGRINVLLAALYCTQRK